MPWSSLATNQCVSLNNLRDAVANGVFIAISAIPSGAKEITKTEALAYVDIQTSPLSSKASNQLVVKNNLNATIYTYNRYDVDTTTCVTSNPIPFWSYFNLPTANYNINGLPYLYQLRPATHSTFTNQISSYVTTNCTPVTRYTYITNNVNTSTCATFNTIQWWSYNNYASGYYYINGPGTLYLLEGSSHTNYSNEITSVSGGTCGTTFYYYKLYRINTCNCSLVFFTVVRSNTYYANGYYNVLTSQPDYVYLESTTPQSYYPAFGVQSTAPSCTAQPCKTYYFHNSGDPGSAQEVFGYYLCDGTFSNLYVNAGATQTGCVRYNSDPSVGSLGDNPYTFNESCCP